MSYKEKCIKLIDDYETAHNKLGKTWEYVYKLMFKLLKKVA